MEDHPLDLSSLDPDTDPLAADRFLTAVMSVVAMRERPTDPDVLTGVWMLARPLLLAASVMLALATAVAVRDRSARIEPARTVAEAVGIPPEFLGGPLGVGGARR